jgi:hypothetical protein
MIDKDGLIELVQNELTELCCDLIVTYDGLEDKAEAMKIILNMMLYFTLMSFINGKLPKEKIHEVVNDALIFIERNQS